MKLSELFDQVEHSGPVLPFNVYLAAPDRALTDVDLVSIDRIELTLEAGEVRFYPNYSNADTEEDSYASLANVLKQLPSDVTPDSDLSLRAEIPLLRQSAQTPSSWDDVYGIRIARDQGAVWLLVRPAAEFASGVLPQ